MRLLPCSVTGSSKEAQSCSELLWGNFAIAFASVCVIMETACSSSLTSKKMAQWTMSTSFSTWLMTHLLSEFITPCLALTIAKFLACQYEKDVLVIHEHLNSCAEAFWEVSAAQEEVPHWGFSDFAYNNISYYIWIC